MAKLIAAVIFTFCFLQSQGQRFGGTPPYRKWRQINTDTARVIFPTGLDSQANRVAGVVHQLAATKPYSLGNQLRKINIVLQPQTVIPNAYVGLGPFRSEFFLTPAANNFDQGSIDWKDQLSLHEYRHVHQFNNFNHGLSKVMRILFGEEGYALAINAAVPDWFYEGDAVFQETVLTPQGRGRLPQFLNAYPSLWLAGKDYSWMKLRNGSLKDYVPNHYELGYMLVNYGYLKYGTDFWRKVTRDASAFKGLFYPWQKAIRKHAGVDYENFLRNAKDFYQAAIPSGPFSTGSPVFDVEKKFVTSYFFPYRSGDSLVYLKSSYRHRPAFYLQTGSGEKRIRFRDISLDQQFSYRNGRIVYAAYENHPRWGWEDYSVLKVLDIASKRQKTLTTRSKYFSPDISETGDKLVAVHYESSGRSELHVINVADGSVTQRIHSFDISLFTDPKFIDEDHVVTAVRLTDGRMTLAMATLSTGVTTRMLPPSYHVIGYPAVDGDLIYFTASFNGNDDIYVLNRNDLSIYRITEGQLGNYFINANVGKLTWSSFTAEGYQLRQMDQSSLRWEAMDTSVLRKSAGRFPIAIQEARPGFLFDSIPARSFAAKGYSKKKGPLNFHSWRPYFEDPVFTFSLYGQNVLNTLQTELYYIYNQEEDEHGVGVNATYGGWFPHINIGSEYIFARKSSIAPVQVWNQWDTRVGLILPISKTSGQTFKDLRLSTYAVLRQEYFRSLIPSTSFIYLQHLLSWVQQVQRAPQHIYPRLGWSLNSSYRHAVRLYDGYQFFGAATFYLPGMLSNHNLVLGGAFQQRDTSRLLFSNRLASARGYLSYYGTNAGSRMLRFSADYHLPIIHPDRGFGNILYFERIRGNLFYDYQRNYFNDKTQFLELKSVGAELFADTRWWNQYPLSFGVRVSRLLDDDVLAGLGRGSYVWELVLPVAIIPR